MKKAFIFIFLISLILFSGCVIHPPEKLVKIDAIKHTETVDYPGERINLVVDGVDVVVTVTEETDLSLVKLGGVNVTARISKIHNPRVFTIGERCQVERYD